MKIFTIQTPKGKRTIGAGHPAFIVAEMSSNHNQDFEKAAEMIRVAAKAGADAVKLQTYTPDTMTMKSDKEWFLVGGQHNPKSWQDKKFYDLYTKSYMPWEWTPKLQKIATDNGITIFSTPFDSTAVDFLESVNVPCYKVAAYECTDIPLLKKIASTKKSVIMSVGFATLEEVELSVKTLRKNGCEDLALLFCTTSYSDKSKPESTNLSTMHDLQKRFDVVVGFSDNMGGITIPTLACAAGASILEKHFVIEDDKKALDNDFSIDAQSFKKMVETIRAHEKIMGTPKYGPQTKEEEYNRRFRRSLFVVSDVKAGETFTKENIRVIRPAEGLAPKHYEEVLGTTALINIEKGTPVGWNMVKRNI